MLKKLLSLLLTVLWLNAANAQSNVIPANFDQYVNEVLKTFQVPGLSIGIVKDGEIILAKGYGIKKLGDPSPVDENTLFSIASNSKAFAATAIAILVDEGKLNWEDKVITHLPWFRMSDDYVTTHLTVRDLFVHHSGIAAYVNDLLLFPPSKFTRKELLEKLKDVEIKYDFRTVYAYDNIMYLATGEIIEKITGQSWEDFISINMFKKMGMNRSISKYSDLKNHSNIAYAHRLTNRKLETVPSFFELNIGDASNPAGGIVSTAKDMSKWLITQLDSGRTPNKTQLFKPSSTKELWKIVRQIPITDEPEWLKPAKKNFSGYALGFRTFDYRGKQIIGHGGLLTGFVSQTAMVPELKLGIVVLTNQLATGAYMSIINHILDHNLNAPKFNWLSGYQKEWEKSLNKRDSIQNVRKQIIPLKNSPLSLPIEKYADNYKDKFIGNIQLKIENGQLNMYFQKSPHHNGKLEHFQGDQFKVTFFNPEMGEGPFITFELNPDQTIRSAKFNSSFSEADNDFENLLLQPNPTAIMDSEQLKTKINTLLDKNRDAKFAIAFKNLGDSETYFLNAKDNFHAASTMKTPVMIEVFKQIEAGKYKLTDSIKVYNKFKSIVDKSIYSLSEKDDSETELYNLIGKKITLEDMLLRMITQSSNLATNILIDIFNAKNANQTMRSLGANDIQVLRGVEDNKAFNKGLNNTVTANDLLLIFEKLGNETLISKSASQKMINILLQQAFKGIIPAKLPNQVRVANKTGSISKVLNDSGIVYLPNGQKYVLVLLSSGIEDEKKSKEILSTISSYFYNYLSNKN